MQCGGTERRQLLQGLLCRTGEYRADELAAEGQPAAGRGADRGGGTGAAGHRLSRARLVGRASPGRGDRRRTSTRLAARGAGRIRFMTDAGGHDRMTALRILATLAFEVAAACAVPGQAACEAPVPTVEPPNSHPNSPRRQPPP